MKQKILLVEDEAGLVLTLTDRLVSEGYDLDLAPDGKTGFQKATSSLYDVIILDVMLPYKNGFDVCRDLRAAAITSPILMLTARGQTIDKVLGLKLGADDYLTKPFEMMELTARIEALLRRSPAAQRRTESPDTDTVTFGEATLNLKTMQAFKGNEPVELSAKEFLLLRYFLMHRGEMLSREELLNAVWGYNAMPTTRTVDVHVAWLRQKFEPNPKAPQLILTVHGLGYKFV
jgi:two-component system, OmpR family, alkaline phosphatase synthesis response regulator PhoP